MKTIYYFHLVANQVIVELLPKIHTRRSYYWSKFRWQFSGYGLGLICDELYEAIQFFKLMLVFQCPKSPSTKKAILPTRWNLLVFVLAAFCWTKSPFYVMLLLSQGCCFIQILLFSYALQEDSVKFSRKFISVPCQPYGRRGISSRRSLVSNIRPDDENFPSRRPSVSRSFEQFKVASIRT